MRRAVTRVRIKWEGRERGVKPVVFILRDLWDSSFLLCYELCACAFTQEITREIAAFRFSANFYIVRFPRLFRRARFKFEMSAATITLRVKKKKKNKKTK